MSNATITSSKVNLVTDSYPKYLVPTDIPVRKRRWSTEYHHYSSINYSAKIASFTNDDFSLHKQGGSIFFYYCMTLYYTVLKVFLLCYMIYYTWVTIYSMWQKLNFVEMAEKRNDAISDTRQLQDIHIKTGHPETHWQQRKAWWNCMYVGVSHSAVNFV